MSDDKLKDIITPMEYEFVELIDERFPKKAIKDAFNLFANKVPGCRLRLANDRLEKLPRAGWVRIGLSKEEAQNVKEHSEKFRAIAEEKQLPLKLFSSNSLINIGCGRNMKKVKLKMQN